MNFLLLLFQTDSSGWEKYIGEGIAVSLIIVILGFILKALPTWKEVKLAELKTREKEAEVQIQVAGALGMLGGSLSQLGTVIHDIAIEQRRATDTVQILQRVNSEESERIFQSVDGLVVRIDGFEQILEEHGLNAKRTTTNRS